LSPQSDEERAVRVCVCVCIRECVCECASPVLSSYPVLAAAEMIET